MGLLRHNTSPKHLRFNNNVKQDLPLPESRIGVLIFFHIVRDEKQTILVIFSSVFSETKKAINIRKKILLL